MKHIKLYWRESTRFINDANDLSLAGVSIILQIRRQKCCDKLEKLQTFDAATRGLYTSVESAFAQVDSYLANLEGVTYDSNTGTFNLPLLSSLSYGAKIPEAMLIELLSEQYGFTKDEIKIMLKLYKGLEAKHPDDAARMFFSLLGGICYGDESNGFKTQAAWFIISEAYPNELIKDIIKNFGLTDEEFRTLEYLV